MSAFLRPYPRLWLGFAGLNGAFTVAVDAYARHHMDPVTGAYARELVGIATKYQSLHALALIAVVLLAARAGTGRCQTALTVAGWAFAVGIVLFCGALYALAAGASPNHALMAPWGGGAFILGWLAILVAGVTWTNAPTATPNERAS